MTTPTIVDPDLHTTILDELAFEPDCEACREDRDVTVPADYYVTTSLDCCGHTAEAFLCGSCKDIVVEESGEPLEDMHCGHCLANEPSYTVDRIEPIR